MNILFVTAMYPRLDNYNSGTFVQHQVDQLIRLGHTVQVLYIPGHRSKLNYLKAAFKVFNLTRKNKFDIVHVHYGLTGLAALFCYKTPWIITLHGGDAQMGIIEPLISKFVCRFSDGVIAVSKEIAKIIPGDVIPCGVDLEIFKPLNQMESRRMLGLPLDKKLILFPFNPKRKEKRFDIAKAVIEKMKVSGMDLDLLIVNNVKNDQMPFYYSASDALILCSDTEGSPTSVKEALACNIPVVSVDVGDVREILDCIPGTAICKKEIDSLVEKLKLILEYNEKKNFNGRCFMKRYDQRLIAMSLLKVYEKTIKNWINKKGTVIGDV